MTGHATSSRQAGEPRRRLPCRAPAAPLPAGLILGLAVLAAGCGPKPASQTSQPPRVEQMTSGPIALTITVDPPAVDFSRDTLITIRAIGPTNLAVRVPSLQGRLAGFTLSGEFDREPSHSGSRVTVEHCARLTPVLNDEYRLGPLAITYTDQSRQPPAAGWFSTRPLVLSAGAATNGPAADIGDIRGLIRVFPPFRTVLLYFLAAVAIAAGAFGLWRLSRRIHREIQLARMSPKERALTELAELLARRLTETEHVREFYYELTMIVRRYIERAHRVRAPEQTTEEFLTAASRDPRFTPPVIARLRAFLQAADLVKYAAVRPEAGAVEQAVQTARSYFETDEAEAAAPEGPPRV